MFYISLPNLFEVEAVNISPIIISSFLGILVFITGCFYTVRQSALNNMYFAFLNCEIFWNFEARKSNRQGEEENDYTKNAVRLLKHANWWRELYEKNCSVVIYCFLSVICMGIALVCIILPIIPFFKNGIPWIVLGFFPFFILSLLFITFAISIFISKRRPILDHIFVRLILWFFKNYNELLNKLNTLERNDRLDNLVFRRINVLNPCKGIERLEELEEEIGKPDWFVENKFEAKI